MTTPTRRTTNARLAASVWARLRQACATLILLSVTIKILALKTNVRTARVCTATLLTVLCATMLTRARSMINVAVVCVAVLLNVLKRVKQEIAAAQNVCVTVVSLDARATLSTTPFVPVHRSCRAALLSALKKLDWRLHLSIRMSTKLCSSARSHVCCACRWSALTSCPIRTTRTRPTLHCCRWPMASAATCLRPNSPRSQTTSWKRLDWLMRRLCSCLVACPPLPCRQRPAQPRQPAALRQATDRRPRRATLWCQRRRKTPLPTRCRRCKSRPTKKASLAGPLRSL
mmetsp:Transcript_16503/g.28356  ORF Transcript_16503/g.28356 Transcript_16503/m.28356 type:complete len:287 (+) Transcript_16503:1205-2065(+)